MVDLKTEYLGLKLKNPLVASSSPLTGHLDSALAIQNAGAACIVLPSLFEEELMEDQQVMHEFIDFQERGFGEADSYLPVSTHYTSHLDEYLENAQSIIQSLDIPVIASLNGCSLNGWVEHAKALEKIGCAAIELNIYNVATDLSLSGSELEKNYIELLKQLKSQVSVPVTVKLSSQFSSIGNFVKQLEVNGADGVVLFNRFYQPDIDLDSLALKPALHLSTPVESLERIRWMALLSKKVNLSLAATGGFHDSSAVLKALLAGGDAVYLCSTLLQSGVAQITELISEIRDWMEQNEYESVAQLKGSLCWEHVEDSSAYERANYLSVLASYQKI
ncbi:MAG: dihydroorotate dehydrogenase-like protein [Gammaproteobacteria bacterium]|nr:dihydroorotate dehydrogenase-like protein [Gammaproteobacteria bacterium]